MIYEQLDALLHALEEELRALSLWEHDMPSFEQLSSTEPFMIDTLDLHQWL
ncbi:MAG: YqcC family protein, partial [Gammaproteobacteria bacterium]